MVDPIFHILFLLLFVSSCILDFHSAKKKERRKGETVTLVAIHSVTALILLITYFGVRPHMPSDLLTKSIGPQVQVWMQELEKLD